MQNRCRIGLLAVAALVIASLPLACSSTPREETPKSPPPLPLITPDSLELVYQDDFSKNTWTVSSNDDTAYEYKNGEYLITNKKANLVCWVRAPIAAMDNGVVEVDARPLSAPDDTPYAILFRETDSNYYRFRVYGDEFSIEKSQKEWSTLVPRTKTTFIKKDGSVNRLKVAYLGDKIECYVNNQRLATITDDTFTAGKVGLAVSGQDSSVAFDNLKIYKFTQEYLQKAAPSLAASYAASSPSGTITITPGVKPKPTIEVGSNTATPTPAKPSVVAAPTPPPAPVAVAPVPLTLPNLVPGYFYPSDGPIVVSSTPKSDFNDELIVGKPVFVTVTVEDRSTIDTSSYFVDLFFDGTKVHRFQTTTKARMLSTWTWDKLLQTANITAGKHSLKILIDPENQVKEANETDNVYETTVQWVTAPTLKATRSYTESQIDNAISTMDAILKAEDMSGGTDWRPQVLEVADVGYYLLTNKSFLDERLQINLLNAKEYFEYLKTEYDRRFAVLPVSEYPRLVQSLQGHYEAPAFEGDGFGKRQIVVNVDAASNPGRLMVSIIHELGHMRQRFLNANQANPELGGNLNMTVLHEAEAQQWEAATLHVLEERSGKSISLYPDTYDRYIDVSINTIFAEYKTVPHFKANLLQFAAALADDVPGLREQLLRGQLPSSSSKQLYDFFVAIPASNVNEYVESRVAKMVADQGSQIRAICKQRLVKNLPADKRGPLGIFVSFILSP